ncbi:hypothetical protein GALMADRAFT_141367 [Galerina marginata CBS 339.88]|uniref:MYND-type domain-containing protein n=1 Tax=Galerina marginata (strain CBS 339.88) TaxID=685588 RepID=A0A067STT0_GALM3|nr:hypothetical protein GALMADRAFT_141367 [Galerina marginata CBS 339.88]
MSTTFRPDAGPNPFHDAPAIHKHKACSYCAQFRRTESMHLQRCARCGLAMYCSKECQQTHWPKHKVECKATVAQNKDIEAKTGIPHGYTDFLQWVEYYATPMKNCMVAALNLPDFPHQERHSALVIQITHKGDPSLPLQHRFIVDTINRSNRGDTDDVLAAAVVVQMLESAEMKATIEFGKTEFGQNYYGTAMMMVLAVFSQSPMISIPTIKCFSIDKSVASAKVISGPWWPPLRRIFESGTKMKFCCRKIDSGIGCCCGGWVHQENTTKDT